jgi:Bacterial conjugation TrbI-like protein
MTSSTNLSPPSTNLTLEQDIGGGKTIAELAKKSSGDRSSALEVAEPNFEEDFNDLDDEVKNPVWKQATSQLTVVAVIGILLFGIVGIALSRIFGVVGSDLPAIPVAATPATPTPTGQPSPNSQLQREVALGDQAQQMKRFNTRPSPTATPTPAPAAERPAPQPVATNEPDPVPISEPAPFPAIRINPSNPLTGIDPMQQWINASNTGSYGQVPAGLSSPSFNRPAIAQRPVNPLSPSPTTITPTSSGRQVLVGSEVKAELETPIAWTSAPPTNRRFIVRVTESLKASNGSVIVPDNSFVVVRVDRADESGLLELSASSVLMVQGDRQVERPLPNGAVMIVDRRGRPLVADSQRRSTFWSRLGTAALAGIENAAGLYNRPTSQSITSSTGGFSSTTQSNDPDYGAAFIQGGTESLVSALQSQQEQSQQDAEQAPPLFVIDQGTKLRLYVNNSFLF